LREWAAIKYPSAHLFEQFRLGPTSAHLSGVKVSPALEALLRVELWYPDGVLPLPNETLVIEAKVKATPGAIGQVKFYLRQAYRTPDFQAWLNRAVVPVVLFAEDDDDVSAFARQEGCRVEIYTPPWIAEYLQQVQYRNRGGGVGKGGNGAS
jgi:hypothetical protein